MKIKFNINEITLVEDDGHDDLFTTRVEREIVSVELSETNGLDCSFDEQSLLEKNGNFYAVTLSQTEHEFDAYEIDKKFNILEVFLSENKANNLKKILEIIKQAKEIHRSFDNKNKLKVLNKELLSLGSRTIASSYKELHRVLYLDENGHEKEFNLPANNTTFISHINVENLNIRKYQKKNNIL